MRFLQKSCAILAGIKYWKMILKTELQHFFELLKNAFFNKAYLNLARFSIGSGCLLWVIDKLDGVMNAVSQTSSFK